MPKKILIISECFYPEEFKINDVAVDWKRKGYDVDVLTLVPTYPLGKVFGGYKNKLLSRETYKGVRVYRLYAVTGYRGSVVKKILKYVHFMVLGSIFSIFIGRKYDYILGFNMSALTSMLPAVIIKKLYKKPVLLWVLDVWPDSVYAYGFKKTKLLSIVLEWFVRFIYKNISAIAVSGKGFEERLRPYTSKSLKFNYVPNWADELACQDNSGQIIFGSSDVVNFTFAGNIGKVQNLENIIKAFQMLPESLQERSQLNIIGDGSNLKKIKYLAGDNLKIVFYGEVARSEMVKYYKRSDFLIVSLIDKPVFSVTIPAKTQTYIAAEKPILAIIKGDTANLVEEHNLGLSVRPDDISSITQLFSRCIYMNKEVRASYTLKNKKLMATEFNKKIIITRLLDIFEGVSQ